MSIIIRAKQQIMARFFFSTQIVRCLIGMRVVKSRLFSITSFQFSGARLAGFLRQKEKAFDRIMSAFPLKVARIFSGRYLPVACISRGSGDQLLHLFRFLATHKFSIFFRVPPHIVSSSLFPCAVPTSACCQRENGNKIPLWKWQLPGHWLARCPLRYPFLPYDCSQ